MKNRIIAAFCISMLIFGTAIETRANEALNIEQTASFDKGKRKKNGRYKKKKHRLKKFLMGKRYCDCPKH